MAKDFRFYSSGNWNKMVLLTALIGLVFTSVVTQAHPVVFKGGTVFSTENSNDMNEYHLAYTFHPQFAAGLHYIKEGTAGMGSGMAPVELQFAQGAWLVKRWLNQHENGQDSQGNIYLLGGVGAERLNNSWTNAEHVDVMADWEDRRFYILGMQRHVWRHSNAEDPNKVNLWHSKVRLGFAPYPSETTELGIWFIAQFDKHNDKNWMTTNLLRFYYRNVLWEVGANLNGGYQLNFMVHM